MAGTKSILPLVPIPKSVGAFISGTQSLMARSWGNRPLILSHLDTIARRRLQCSKQEMSARTDEFSSAVKPVHCWSF